MRLISSWDGLKPKSRRHRGADPTIKNIVGLELSVGGSLTVFRAVPSLRSGLQRKVGVGAEKGLGSPWSFPRKWFEIRFQGSIWPPPPPPTGIGFGLA